MVYDFQKRSCNPAIKQHFCLLTLLNVRFDLLRGVQKQSMNWGDISPNNQQSGRVSDCSSFPDPQFYVQLTFMTLSKWGVFTFAS